jgi:hypothetical protein
LHRGGGKCSEANAHGWRLQIKPQRLIDPRDHPRVFVQPLRRLQRVIFYRNQSVLSVLNISRQSDNRPVDRPVNRPAQKAPDQRKGTALQWVRVWVASGTAFATRQSFSRSSQTDHLIIFKICRFSNALFLNLGATGFHCEWRARALRREPSEGYFSEPRLLASHPVCPNSFLGFLCLHC